MNESTALTNDTEAVAERITSLTQCFFHTQQQLTNHNASQSERDQSGI
jgi:hypothetical protein